MGTPASKSQPSHNQPAVALTIAGSDSGGGAGIQADLKTFADFGVHGTCALTAITAQNTRGVSAVASVQPALLKAQLQAVLEDFAVRAIKTGMLANAALIETVIDVLGDHAEIPLVVDPVMVATSGDALLSDDAVDILREGLLPLATVITPNLPEAEVLLGDSIADPEQMQAAAKALLKLGPQQVVLKGGHLEDDSAGDRVRDWLVSATGAISVEHPRLAVEGHGTGCTLAAGMAAGLALGQTSEQAFATATDYVARVLADGAPLGGGPVTVLAHGRVAGKGS